LHVPLHRMGGTLGDLHHPGCQGSSLGFKVTTCVAPCVPGSHRGLRQTPRLAPLCLCPVCVFFV
jgi:hypothetical protein